MCMCGGVVEVGIIALVAGSIVGACKWCWRKIKR